MQALTPQEFLEIATRRAQEMEKPAITDAGTATGRCLLRSPNGPCLVGAAILDDQYSKDLEYCTISALKKRIPQFRDLPVALLRDVQLCHDGVCYETDENAYFTPEAKEHMLERLSFLSRAWI